MGDEVMMIRGTVEGNETVQALGGGLLVEAELGSRVRSDSSDRSIDDAPVGMEFQSSRERTRARIALVRKTLPAMAGLLENGRDWSRFHFRA